MAVKGRRYPMEEFARRGKELYERVVRPTLSSADHGRFVAIDIESGQYEIADTERTAGDRLYARVPDAQPWMVRVGFRTTRKFGGHLRRSGP